MTRRASAAAFALAIGLTAGCAAPTRLFGDSPPRHARADALAALPGFVIVPALDQRPAAEHAGSFREIGFVMVTSGAFFGHGTGVIVLGGDDQLAWGNQAFTGLPASTATAVAADLGRALEDAAGRPVSYRRGSLDDAAVGAPDGSIVIALVIDHLTQITPSNADASQTTTQQGNYQVTTTASQTESMGPFWTFSFRVQLGEVRGGRITRRQVRYVSHWSPATSGYAETIDGAAGDVIEAVATEWIDGADRVVAGDPADRVLP